MSLINKSNGLHNERSIVEKFSMHTENGGLTSTEACFDLIMQFVKLCLCSIQCVLQPIAFGARVAGIIFDDKVGLLLVLANGTDGQAARSWYANKSCACCLRCPALSAARRSRWKLFFRQQAASPRYLHDGDVITATIAAPDGQLDLGTQRNTVVRKTS